MPRCQRFRPSLPYLLVCLLMLMPLRAGAEMSKGFRRLLDAVVRIDVREIEYESGEKHFENSVGSGVIYSKDGLILTNAHVVSPRAVEISITLANLEKVNASFVGWDHWTDLAVLRLDMDDIRRRHLSFSYAEFGDSDRTFIGEEVYAAGTPHGLTRTVTKGIISNNNRYFEDSRAVRGYETGSFNTWIQTDAAINPGNSGGPLVTADGQIIGINARGYVGADNLGFAIPANVARGVVHVLESKGRVQRSYVGIVPGALRDLENFYELKINTGVLVNNVDTGSPAAKAGIRGGDILLTINGKALDGRFPEQLPPIQNLIASQPVGAELTFVVKRGQESKLFKVRTEQLESRIGDESSLDRWGLNVREVSRAYARENQLPDITGLIVIGLRPGFPADVAGLQRNDILLSINRQPVTSLEDARRLLQEYEKDPKPVLIEARRNRSVTLYVLKP